MSSPSNGYEHMTSSHLVLFRHFCRSESGFATDRPMNLTTEPTFSLYSNKCTQKHSHRFFSSKGVSSLHYFHYFFHCGTGTDFAGESTINDIQ